MNMEHYIPRDLSVWQILLHRNMASSSINRFWDACKYAFYSGKSSGQRIVTPIAHLLLASCQLPNYL
jgi:hypothetical protein